jgi:hypothetical protein
MYGDRKRNANQVLVERLHGKKPFRRPDMQKMES